MPDIFLSYGHDDVATARQFAQAFERAGFGVWWDATLHSGDSFDAAIEAALRSAKAVVVLWSTTSVQSRWVRAEATLADRLNTLVPVMIEACERPIMFELTQTASLAHWSGDEQDEAWCSLVADVRRCIQKREGHSAEVPARKATSSAAPERGGEPGVAILPIVSRSALAEDEVFAEDLLSEVAAELSRHGYCRVTTQVAAAAHPGAKDPRALARELEVRYLVEGHTRRIGTNLRLMVQLTEGTTGNILWSQKYERPLSALSQLQDEMAVAVASQIGEQVLHLEFEHARRKAGNWTAWERTLRGMACMMNINPESMRISIEEARAALRIAPDYALAHAQLTVSLAADTFISGNGNEASVRAEVRLHVKRALELAPSDSRVLQFAANAASLIGDLAACLRYSERAVELTPHVGHAHHCLGSAYFCLGRNEEALAEFDIEERLAPHDGIRYLTCSLRGMAYFAQGHLAEAETALDRSLKLNPAWIWGLKWKGIVASALGRHEEGIQFVRELRAALPATLELHEAQISSWIADKARAREATEILRRLWLGTEAAT